MLRWLALVGNSSVRCALIALLFSRVAYPCGPRVALGGDDDGMHLLSILGRPPVVKFLSLVSSPDRVAYFRRLRASDQESILDAMAIYRMEARGTMREMDAIRLLGECLARDTAHRQLPLNTLSVGVRHLMAVYSPVESTWIAGIEVVDQIEHGMSQLNSNAGWNRGVAMLTVARAAAEQGLPENTQAIIVKSLHERLLGNPLKMSHDALERRMAIDAAGVMLAPESLVLASEKKRLRDLLHDVVREYGTDGEVGQNAHHILQPQ